MVGSRDDSDHDDVSDTVPAPQGAVLDEALTTGMVVVDANVLLHLYRIDNDGRQRLLSVLDTVRPRLWVPHQVMMEVRENAPVMFMHAERERATDIRYVKKLGAQIRQYVSARSRRHAWDSRRVQTVLTSFGIGEEEVLTLFRESGPERDLCGAAGGGPDLIWPRIEQLVAGRLGPEPDMETRGRWIADSEARLRDRLPPSHADRRKKVPQRHNDCVIWHQIMERAAHGGAPVVLVTDDLKESGWVERRRSVPVGAHRHLVTELWAAARVPFVVISAEQLMEYVEQTNQAEAWSADRGWGDEADEGALRPLPSHLFNES